MAQHSWEGRKGRREDEGGAQEELEDVAQVAQIRGAGTRSMGQQICRIPATFLKGKKYLTTFTYYYRCRRKMRKKR